MARVAARVQPGNGLLERRRNQCRAWKRRALDWWTLKCISDRGKRCQALSERRLTIDKARLSLEFVIHLLRVLMEFPAHRFGTYEEIMKYCARCKKKKSLFCWLRPYGDRDTIKLLSWRQGWNWTVLLVTWLPLSNDNLGFNQKEPLSAWLIEKSRTGTPHSQGRASLFAHFVNSLSTCSLTDNSIKKIILYIGLYVFIAYKLLNRKCPPPTFFDVFFRLKLDCEPHHIKKLTI